MYAKGVENVHFFRKVKKKEGVGLCNKISDAGLFFVLEGPLKKELDLLHDFNCFFIKTFLSCSFYNISCYM